MKQYTVEITEEALADMEQLYNHIAFVLLAPESAMGQYNRIADEILKLEVFPERFRIMDSEPEHSKVIRRMPVDYEPDEQMQREYRKKQSSKIDCFFMRISETDLEIVADVIIRKNSSCTF